VTLFWYFSVNSLFLLPIATYGHGPSRKKRGINWQQCSHALRFLCAIGLSACCKAAIIHPFVRSARRHSWCVSMHVSLASSYLHSPMAWASIFCCSASTLLRTCVAWLSTKHSQGGCCYELRAQPGVPSRGTMLTCQSIVRNTKIFFTQDTVRARPVIFLFPANDTRPESSHAPDWTSRLSGPPACKSKYCNWPYAVAFLCGGERKEER